MWGRLVFKQWLPIATSALALAACDPYTRFTGDSNAGAVDPVGFPAAYLGEDGDPKFGGMGLLMAATATAGGETVGYYAFPFTGNDLSLSVDGELIAPLAYDFDEDGMSKCVPPESYLFDQQRDAVRFDEQGAIFTQLPDADGYAPVVADVAVHSKGLPCQDVKSEARLVERKDVTLELVPAEHPDQPGAHATGKPSGVYYARPIIDPTIDVRFPDGSLDPNTGLGPQKWGWYQRYLLAYLDGGAIPTLDKDVPNQGGKAERVTQMITQPIYFPTRHPGTDDLGNAVPVDGALGEGFDILTAKRGDPAYSPLCEVYAFVPLDEMNPETDVANIDTSSAQPTGEYVWCIQVTSIEVKQ